MVPNLFWLMFNEFLPWIKNNKIAQYLKPETLVQNRSMYKDTAFCWHIFNLTNMVLFNVKINLLIYFSNQFIYSIQKNTVLIWRRNCSPERTKKVNSIDWFLHDSYMSTLCFMPYSFLFKEIIDNVIII